MAKTSLTGAFIQLLCINLLYSYAASDPIIACRKSDMGQRSLIIMRHQANNTIYPISGLSGLGIDTVHPRLEIRELERDADQFNVYLLGLQRFQNKSQDDKLSYFQISGIHGRPFVAWDGVEQHMRGKDGYCMHSSNIFPSWHRPYLALFEELLYLNAQEAISQFPSGELKDRMKVALQTFRLPYWDAAAVPPEGEGSYPACVQRRTVVIELPDGNKSMKTDIPNPLYSYTFHPLPVEAFKGTSPEFARWNFTKRFPTSKGADAESQDYKVAYELDLNRDNLRQRTYYMLAMQKEYQNFSNNMVESELNGVVVDSLESVHDSIHNTVGSGGHLTHIAYSAFDPVFWLLHANTDRMFAIWQALNPERYVINHTNLRPTFTTPKYSWADENTPLHPFHCNSAGEFWTSASIRNHTIFGYTYPELISLSEEATLVRRVNALYGENATSQFSFRGGDPISRPIPISSPTTSSSAQEHVFLPSTIAEKQSATSTSESQPSDIIIKDQLQANNETTALSGPQCPHNPSVFQYQYFVNIRARNPKAALKIYIFLSAAHEVDKSEPNTNTSNWMRDPGFVGFTGFQTKGVDMAMDEADENGVVALSKALEDRVRMGLLKGMEEEDVKKYLERNLGWRVSMANDRFVEAKIVGRFAIEVSYAKTKWATRDGFPEVQDGFRHLMHVARGERGHLEEQEEDDDGDAGKEDTHGGPSDKSRVVE